MRTPTKIVARAPQGPLDAHGRNWRGETPGSDKDLVRELIPNRHFLIVTGQLIAVPVAQDVVAGRAVEDS